jgi:hypothetical protein
MCSQVSSDRRILLGDDGGGYKELTEKFPYIMPNARYYSI